MRMMMLEIVVATLYAALTYGVVYWTTGDVNLARASGAVVMAVVGALKRY